MTDTNSPQTDLRKKHAGAQTNNAKYDTTASVNHSDPNKGYLRELIKSALKINEHPEKALKDHPTIATRLHPEFERKYPDLNKREAAQKKFNCYTLDLSGNKIKSDDDLIYMLKYLHDELLFNRKYARGWPSSYEAAKKLQREKSYFFSSCHKPPRVMQMHARCDRYWKKEESDNVDVNWGEYNEEDYVIFTGDYDKVVYFDSIYLQINPQLGDRGVQFLVEFLVLSNIFVRDLRIYDCSFGELGAFALGYYISKVPVEQMHLSGNFIARLGAMGLLAAAALNPNLPIIFPGRREFAKYKAAGDDPPHFLDHGRQVNTIKRAGVIPMWLRLEKNP